jgi:hypothetical protein
MSPDAGDAGADVDGASAEGALVVCAPRELHSGTAGTLAQQRQRATAHRRKRMAERAEANMKHTGGWLPPVYRHHMKADGTGMWSCCGEERWWASTCCPQARAR